VKKIVTILVVLLSGAVAQATIDFTNSHSRIEDEIQYTILTDKAIYQLGEEVHIQYHITNLSTTEEKVLGSTSYPPYHLWIENQDDERIASFGGHFPVVSTINLLPQETVIFPYPWNSPEGTIWEMTDDNGEVIDLGIYGIFGGITVYSPIISYSVVSVPIQIIPEPASLVLLSIGLLRVRKKKRNRT
jgi:hypothetical protein